MGIVTTKTQRTVYIATINFHVEDPEKTHNNQDFILVGEEVTEDRLCGGVTLSQLVESGHIVKEKV